MNAEHAFVALMHIAHCRIDLDLIKINQLLNGEFPRKAFAPHSTPTLANTGSFAIFRRTYPPPLPLFPPSLGTPQVEVKLHMKRRFGCPTVG